MSTIGNNYEDEDEDELFKNDDSMTQTSSLSNNNNNNNYNSPTALITPNTKSNSVGVWEEDAQLTDYYSLLQLMEEMLAGRNADRTTTVVTAIVQYIIKSWTEHFARTVAMKFNCFYLMPFLDDFPVYLVRVISVSYYIHTLTYIAFIMSAVD